MKDLLEVLSFSGSIRLGFQVLTEVNSKITPFFWNVMVLSLVFVCHHIGGTCYISTSTLKMDGANFSKTSTPINHITRYHIPENRRLVLSMILKVF
jgi:hypothetical protein